MKATGLRARHQIGKHDKSAVSKFQALHSEERRRAPRFPFAMDVQVARGEELVLCKSFDVSLYGLYLCTDRPSPPHKVVSVRVQRGLEDPINWMGLVQRVIRPEDARPEQPAGMALEVYGIGEADWERWCWLLLAIGHQCEASYGPQQTRRHGESATRTPRRHHRYRMPVEIRVTNMPGLVRFAARDISAGGTFIRNSAPVALGTDLDLHLKHPISQDVFQLEGQVVRIETGGFAVAFNNITDGQRQQLKRFIVSGKRPG